MTRVFEWFKNWIRDLATTPYLIVWGVHLAALYVVWALAADTFGRPISANTLETIGLFIYGMLTGGVIQFGAKRFSDKGYAAAKAAATGPSVAVESARTVQASGDVKVENTGDRP